MPFYDPLIDQWVQDNTLSPAEQASIEMGDVPDQATPLAPAAPPSTNLQPGSSYSTTTETFNPEAAKARYQYGQAATAGLKRDSSKRFQEDLQSQLGANDEIARIQSEAQGDAQAPQRAYDAVMAGGGTPEEAQAAFNQAATTSGVGGAQAKADQVAQQNAQDMADLKTRQAVEAQAEEDKWAARVGEEFTNWKAQAARVSAMRVDPDRLMKNAGPTGRLGFGAMAFMEGFLGAKGIKVRAIDEVNKRINDDINAQLTDIEQGRETTAQFRMFYEAARQGAGDARLVRDKIQGMYWTVAEQKGLANIAGAKSGVDAALNAQLLAGIQAKKVANEAEIKHGIADEVQKQRNYESSLAAEYARMANEKTIAQMRIDADKAKAEAANKPEPSVGIFAPAGVNQNISPDQPTRIGDFRPEFAGDPVAIRDVAKVSGDAAGMIRRGRVLRDKIAAYNHRIYQGPGSKVASRVFKSQEAQDLYTEYLDYLNEYSLYITGKQSSEQEAKRIADTVPLSSILGVSPETSANAVNRQVENGLHRADDQISVYADPKTWKGYAQGWTQEAKDWNKPVPVSEPQRAAKAASQPGDVYGGVQPSSLWGDYLSQHKGVPPASGPGIIASDTLEPPAFRDLDTMAMKAAAGDAEMLHALKAFSQDPHVHENRRAYAAWLLSQPSPIDPNTSIGDSEVAHTLGKVGFTP